MIIKQINQNVEVALDVIREAYITVANEYGITRENGASNPAFIELKHLLEMDHKGIEMYGAFVEDTCVGFVGIENANNGLYYLEKLAVLPSERHKGYGKKLMDFVFDRVKELGGNKISIGIINENTVLKEWYIDYGFVETDIRNYAHLPFTVCLLVKAVKMNEEIYYYHLVTNRKMEAGQIISFTKNESNTLYSFFFQKEFRNSKNQDVTNIISENITDDGMRLNAEDSDILNRYLDNSSRSIREAITEMVRLKEFPNYPSRLSCLYVARNYDEVLKWKTLFESYNRKILQIVKLKTDGSCFVGDGNALPDVDAISFEKKIEQARRYWEGYSDDIYPEVLIDGNIEVVEIIQEFE